jgi:hypothetical protein
MRGITAIVISIILVVSVAAPIALAQGPPTDFDDSFTIDGICAFPVLVELSGKAKTIGLPDGRAILTSPGVTATLTNLDNPTKQESLGITGAFHLTFPENGDVEFVVTGRNLLVGFDPEAAFVVAIGRFSFVLDAEGNLIQPVSGKGQLIDVCTLLE